MQKYDESQSRQSARLFLRSSELGLPHPLPAGEFSPRVCLGGGGHSLGGEGVGEGPDSDEGTDTVVL